MHAVACAALALSLLLPQTQEQKPESLVFGKKGDQFRGVQSMAVTVATIRNVGETETTKAKTAVELKLRQNGITVVDDVPENSKYPYLYVNVNTMPVLSGNSYVFNVHVEFRRFVKVMVTADRAERMMAAAVWSESTVGTTDKENVDYIHRSLSDLVDMFLNDWLAANPVKR